MYSYFRTVPKRELRNLTPSLKWGKVTAWRAESVYLIGPVIGEKIIGEMVGKWTKLWIIFYRTFLLSVRWSRYQELAVTRFPHTNHPAYKASKPRTVREIPWLWISEWTVGEVLSGWRERNLAIDWLLVPDYSADILLCRWYDVSEFDWEALMIALVHLYRGIRHRSFYIFFRQSRQKIVES